jgi:transglutaminase-like putative cysteine protease
MVSTASSTLWITRQLDLWALAGQAIAIVASLTLRRRPHPWQQSPVVLNLGMLAVVVATIAVAVSGKPSTVALAHFAALTQGLQLLDARPRRSEFLLVALALFQVLLASSLTDSVFFVPLLACFVVATAWTLIVHTLRTEALEAGMPSALPAAITPGLLRTTLLASTASIALALLLFVLLPRMESALARGTGFGASTALVGFSDRVELGDLGRLRQDRSVALRIETLKGEPPDLREAYWRGLAFDTFDGRSWSISPPRRHLVARSTELGVGLQPRQGKVNLIQRIVREPVASGVLFSAGDALVLHGPLRFVERDVNGGLYAASQARDRLRYTVSSQTRSPSDADLLHDRSRPPPEDGARFLALSPFDPAVAGLAEQIVAGRAEDAARVRALENYLRRTGRYTDTPPRLSADDPRSPVEAFLLGERAGHCEYFATAMVVLSRSLGIPARLVNGFAGGENNRIGGFIELSRSDAHAWVEVYYEKAGWVRYDPTPPDLRLRRSAGSWFDPLRSLGSAVELWWFRRVVDFDRSDQLRALRGGWLTWRRLRTGEVPAKPRSFLSLGEWRFAEVWVLRLIAGALVTLVATWLLRRGCRRRRSSPTLPRSYARALRLLERRGLVREASATARDFARQVHGVVPPAAASAFDALTDAYLEERFGGRVALSARSQYRRLRAALRA